MNNLPINTEPAGPAGSIHVSNLLTYTALLAGCGAAAFAISVHHRAAAGALMAVAVIADTFDGRFARLFGRTRFQSEFGVQLDSLADAVTSGFVPVIVLASDSTPATWGAAIAWWGCEFLYALAAITRLGYYNLKHGDGPWFVGLPAPFCALVVATSLLWSPHPLAAAVILVCCAVAMVAPMRLARPRAAGLAAFVGWAMLLVVLHAGLTEIGRLRLW
jgi:CDP-diacylglycerol--serine O-phosphatidyltransferase